MLKPAELAVDIENLIVRYPGQGKKALDGLSLKIERGSFFGLLGPNGAGKTTLISFLCGQIQGTYARALVFNVERAQLSSYKMRLGYAPQEIALYPMLSARRNLDFFARMGGVPSGEVERVLEWVNLTTRAEDKVASFSGGMKRRLNLGVALLNSPDLLILDEPTVGVDPQSRGFIFDRLLELKAKGLTLIYSSHYLEEVEKLCDSVGILQNGRLTAQGDLREVLGQGSIEQNFLELTGRAVVD